VALTYQTHYTDRRIDDLNNRSRDLNTRIEDLNTLVRAEFRNSQGAHALLWPIRNPTDSSAVSYDQERLPRVRRNRMETH
jgi:hypothetical protein